MWAFPPMTRVELDVHDLDAGELEAVALGATEAETQPNHGSGEC